MFMIIAFVLGLNNSHSINKEHDKQNIGGEA